MEIPTAINNRARSQVADDDGRRVGGRVGFDGALEAGLVEHHLAALHVASGAGAANVDQAVERADGQRPAGAVAERSMRFIDHTMRLRARLVHRTGVRGTGGTVRRALRCILLANSSRWNDKFSRFLRSIQWCQRIISQK